MQRASVKGYALPAVLGGLMVLALAACTSALASPWVEEIRHDPGFIEMRISGMAFPDRTMNKSAPYLVLSCRNAIFNFVLNWQRPVGRLGERRRHLFYHVDGDSHLMLPVVDKTGQSTGYLNQSDKAESLVHEILATLNKDVSPISVFPAGADPVTGEWIDAWLPADAFKESVLSIAKVCKFDPTSSRPKSHSRDKIPPARPGGS